MKTTLSLCLTSLMMAINSPLPAKALPVIPNNSSAQTYTNSNSGELIASMSDTFFCGKINALPTIMARHHWGNIPVISFKTNAFSSDGWSPEKRCEEIAKRLDEFHQKGWLKYLVLDKNMPVKKGNETVKVQVICISDKSVPHRLLPKGQVGLLMTLTKEDDGEAIIKSLKNISLVVN